MRFVLVAGVGAAVFALTLRVPGLEPWAPYVLLLTGGGLQFLWIMRKEEARTAAAARGRGASA